MAAKCGRQLIEHVFALAAMAVLLSTNEALLTRALICIMPVDHPLCCLAWMIQKHSSTQSSGVVKKLKVVQCFSAMSFRGVVPLVCLVVSVSVFDANVLAMKVQSVIVLAASVVAYLFCNAWLIATSTREVWLLYSRQQTNNKVGNAKSMAPARTNNNQRSPKAKASPLEFPRNDIGQSGSTSCSKCDTNRCLQQMRCQFTENEPQAPARVLAMHNPTTHNIAQSTASASAQSSQVNTVNAGTASGKKQPNRNLTKHPRRVLATIEEEEAESMSSSRISPKTSL